MGLTEVCILTRRSLLRWRISETRNLNEFYILASNRVFKIGVEYIKTHHREIRCDGYFVHLDGCGFVTASNKLVLCVSEYVRLNKQ